MPRAFYVPATLGGPYVAMRELSTRYKRDEVLMPQPQDELGIVAGDDAYMFFGTDPGPELSMPALGFELDDLLRLRGVRVGYRPTDLHPYYELIRDYYRPSPLDQIRRRGQPMLSMFADAMTTFNRSDVYELAGCSKRTFSEFAARCGVCQFALETDLGGNPQILVAGNVPLRVASQVRLGGRWHDLPLW
jgi:hypothetical protein